MSAACLAAIKFIIKVNRFDLDYDCDCHVAGIQRRGLCMQSKASTPGRAVELSVDQGCQLHWLLCGASDMSSVHPRHFKIAEGLRPMLPVELLTIISSLVRNAADLAALASTSKHMNLIATPYLYTELDLFTYRSALACLMTLASSPAALTFPGRDLAAFVQSFRLRSPCLWYNPLMMNNDCEQLGRLLSAVVPRMVNLRELDCGPRGLASARQVLAALIRSPHPQLESIYLCLLSPVSTSAVHGAPLALVSHQFPKLQTITLFTMSRSSIEDIAYLRTLLHSSAGQLRRMTIATSTAGDLLAIIPQDSTLPRLEHLEIIHHNLYDPVCMALTNLRSLAVRAPTFTFNDLLPLPATAYPALEEIACIHSQLSIFLSPDIAMPRPIHTVTLDYTKYERNGGETTEAAPDWEDIFVAFTLFRYSAVPIRHLRFFVDRLLIPELQAALLEGCPALESLTMVVWHEPKRDALFALGERVFSQLPRLHTFLLGDVVKKQYDHKDCFWFARDVALQRELLAEFERHTSALRRVAFTTEFEWEKGEDGRWYTTEVVDPEVREEPEDEAESSSDSDSDSDMDSD